MKHSIYQFASCDVYYEDEKNVALVCWKSYCELEQYRTPLEYALRVISEYPGCNYAADTRNGFEDITTSAFLCAFRHQSIRSSLIKFVGCHGSPSGRPYFSLPSATDFIKNVIFLARIRIFIRPSASYAASPDSLP